MCPLINMTTVTPSTQKHSDLRAFLCNKKYRLSHPSCRRLSVRLGCPSLCPQPTLSSFMFGSADLGAALPNIIQAGQAKCLKMSEIPPKLIEQAYVSW